MIIVRKLKKVEIENPIFIYGVGGGMGNVAKLVAEKIIKTYKAQKFMEFYVDSLPDEVFVNKNGIIHALKYKFYYFKHNEKDFVIMHGETQPIDIIGRYEVCNRVLKFLKELNCEIVVSLGGYGVELEPEEPKVYISANNKKILEEIKNKLGEDFNLYKNSSIVGMSGLIVALAKKYKIPGIVMLAETYPTNTIYGYLGAKAILRLLSKLYGFEYDLKDYEEKGKELREMFKIRLRPPEKKEERRKDIYYFG